MKWSDIALNMGGLAATALGGPVLGGLLGPGLQMLGSAFSSGGSSSASDATFGQDFGRMLQMQDASAFNTAGMKGNAAAAQAQEKARQYIGKQSVEGSVAANTLRNIAATQLGAPQTILDTAAANTQRELGNQRRSFMESANASGVPLAARIAGLSNLGQAAGQNLGNLFSQGLQGTQQALAASAGTTAAASDLTQKDLQTQASMFQPYAMQMNPAMSASQLGAMGGYRQNMTELAASEDPAALAKSLIGQGSAINFMDPFQKITLQRQAAAQRGEDPTKYSYGLFG